MIITKLIICFLSYFVAHPFHVSVCEVNYKQGENTLQISHRIFMDDLENALSDYSKEKIYMQKTDEKLIHEALEDYLREKFEILAGGSIMDMSLIGYEIERDVVWAYQEVQNVKSSSRIIITNKLLLEIFDDQQNLVHVSRQGTTQSIRLNKRKPSDSISFE